VNDKSSLYVLPTNQCYLYIFVLVERVKVTFKGLYSDCSLFRGLSLYEFREKSFSTCGCAEKSRKNTTSCRACHTGPAAV